MSAKRRRSVRSRAAKLLDRELRSWSALRRRLDAATEGLADRDRRLLQELVHGSLRWRARIDHVIETAAKRPLHRIDAVLRAPLRLAVYELLFLDRVPDYATVSEAVREAKRRAPQGVSFVNAVLRKISRSQRLEAWPVESTDPIERQAIETSHPRFLVERWINEFGAPRTAAILEANNRRPALHLLAFNDRGGRELLARKLAAEGVESRPLDISPLALEITAGHPLSTRSWEEGDFYLQDQASQAAALIPPPSPGERVFDVAAAPGGKSFALLAAEPTVRVVAADVSRVRISTLRANRRRLDRSLSLVASDASRSAVKGSFDRVVVDLPCSGTGILSRHPDLKWRLKKPEIGRLAAAALDMLHGVADTVRPGGVLVAMTCSIERKENEVVADVFLRGQPDFTRVDLDDVLEPPASEYIRGPGLWRLLPGPHNDGFTVQVVRRAA